MAKQYTPKPAAAFDNFRAADHFGTTVSITVIEYTPDFPTVHGDRPCIKADVTLVDGLLAGKDFNGVLIFDKAIVDDLMDEVGEEPTIARIESYLARGKDCAKLVAPTADAWDAGMALYHAPVVHEAGF